MKRDLVTIFDFSADEIGHLMSVAARLKSALGARHRHDWLAGRTLAMIFEKPSLRTRVTFETGMFQLGGHAIYLAPSDIRLGTREPPADIARNLSQWVDGILARTFAHSSVVELADSATVPVVNGLSDLYHPCQVLADCFTLSELRPRLADLKIVFVGDGNNMVHSWLLAAARLGLDFTVVCPPGYTPDPDIVERARTSGAASVTVTDDVVAGTRGADVLYTDVWMCMGQEEETAKRLADFSGFQVDGAMLERAHRDAVVMHCLPAHRGEEITAEVVDGPQSVILRQAENRLHVQKAILAFLLDAEEARP